VLIENWSRAALSCKRRNQSRLQRTSEKQFSLFKMSILATSFAAACASAHRAPSGPVSKHLLTVPQKRLPAGCGLAPRSISLGNGRVRMLWAGLPIQTNPWTGTDRFTIASIGTRLGGPPLTPDGPLLIGSQARRYFLRTADDVEEGYAAFYFEQSDAAIIGVYALKFTDIASNIERFDNREPPNAHLVKIGRTVAFVSGNGGRCFEAVEGYLKTVRSID
jgi:hypothetical protein